MICLHDFVHSTVRFIVVRFIFHFDLIFIVTFLFRVIFFFIFIPIFLEEKNMTADRHLRKASLCQQSFTQLEKSEWPQQMHSETKEKYFFGSQIHVIAGMLL